MPEAGTTKDENTDQIPLNPPFLKGDIMILPLLKGDFIVPLFGKEGLGEIFIILCDDVP